MSSQIRMGRKGSRGLEKAKEARGDERVHVNLTIRRQVWTLAKEKFPNVSRLVESLLEMALNLKSSVEIVRIGDLSGGSLAWSRTAACHAAGPGSNPGHRTTICF
ncbi:MAG: hypothetical protein XD54_0742 [Thermococcus sibiricus]|uniref:Uncharacterized protein n=1 Tax=Thermococcus sibiricus TaxID=172049 RepID=A0A101EN55_9EURY|nr:MAG: hypothetical protein XD54_0742 [Thermococcus sibiricus]